MSTRNTVLVIVVTVVIALMLAGCVSVEERPRDERTQDVRSRDDRSPEERTPGDAPDATAGTTAGTTAGATASTLESIMRDLSPRSGKPVFLGVSPRLRNRDEELPAAILHAAEQASRYTGMAARYRILVQREARSLGVLDNIQVDWDAALADRLVESVEVLETIRDEQGTYVLARVDDVPSAPEIRLGKAAADEVPTWVTTPPEIPGFMVTVGITQRSRRLRDSIDTADQEALKELLLQTGSTIRLMEERRDVERMGTLDATTSDQIAEAVVRQFLVISRYSSPDGRYYYSLVIASRAQD